MSMLPPTSSDHDQSLRHPAPNGLSVNGRSLPAPNGVKPRNTLPTLGGVSGLNLQQKFDFWGPLQRRKYLIALFCLIGLGLGFLYYVKTPKTYESAIRLMITTQAPPSVVDGDMQVQNTSLVKHAALIGSALVLSDAIKNGKMESLRCFDAVVSPIQELKTQMLTVSFDERESETLVVRCTGGYPDELPTILNQIVDSYRKTIGEDSQSFGEESGELIQQLADKLSNEKRKAEELYVTLYAKLGVTALARDGQVINPYTDSLFALLKKENDNRSSLRQLSDQIELIEGALASKSDKLVQVVAFEAKKYLGLGGANETGAGKTISHIPGLRSRDELERSLRESAKEIAELRFEKSKLGETYGAGHQKITILNDRIAYVKKVLFEINQDLAFYDREFVKQQQEYQLPGKESLADSSLESLRSNADRHWIDVYRFSLDRDRQKLQREEEALLREIKSMQAKAEEVASGINELNVLQKQIFEKGEAVRAILDRLNEMNVLSQSYSMTKVRVLDPAEVGEAIAPSLVKSLGYGMIAAFVFGFGLAVLVDQTELSFRCPSEIAEKLQIPVVGRIPRIDISKIRPTKGSAELVVAHAPGGTTAESFRDIRTSLFFQSILHDTKTILFTSPSPGDGKSTTVANLALSIGQAGKRVILVDADFRRPRIQQYFGEKMNPGLVDVLAGQVKLEDAIQESELQAGVFLLTAGGHPKNPGEMVASVEFRNLLHTLREKFDFVLIDSPPVLPVSDPASIASHVDGVYLVTRIRKGVKVTAARAKESLDRVGTRWMGIIVNGIDENPHYSEYGYQYGFYSFPGGRYDEKNIKEYREKIATS